MDVFQRPKKENKVVDPKKKRLDGTGIIPIVHYKNKPTTIVLIANFRIVTNSFSLEFPAGMIDKNETVK